jgi:hypothetical protein
MGEYLLDPKGNRVAANERGKNGNLRGYSGFVGILAVFRNISSGNSSRFLEGIRDRPLGGLDAVLRRKCVMQRNYRLGDVRTLACMRSLKTLDATMISAYGATDRTLACASRRAFAILKRECNS